MAEFVEYTEPTWRGLDMRALKVDEAYLNLISLYNKETYMYTLSDECYTCPYTKMIKLKISKFSENANILKTNVAHGLKFKILDTDVGRYSFENQSPLCRMEQIHMQEFGVYNFTVTANGTCNFLTDKPGVNVHFSIISVFVLVTLILLVIKISWCAWRIYRYDELARAAAATDPATTTRTTTTATTRVPKQRMYCLDTFRGLAIVLMIFVNSGGGAYWWIEHAPWNGLHLADIVFPLFLWIMGVCIPMSVASQLARGTSRTNICGRIIWRSIKLFLLGLCLNSINGPPLEMLRIMGVLQRFGISFLVCGILYTCCSKKDYTTQTIPQQVWKRGVYDLVILKFELFAIFGLIISYLGVTFGFPVPDCPKGYMGPGGKHAYAAYINCTGGAAGFIDLQILGNTHIYQHSTAKYIYESEAFDPEGLFGCILTIVQVLLGLIAGKIMLIHSTWQSRIIRWMVWASFAGLIGGLLCLFSKENGIIPINKNLWSLSYVLVTASLAFLILSILYFVNDVRALWSGYPFLEAGKNAIILYVGHTIMHKTLPWHWQIGPMNTHFTLLLESLWNTLLWIIIALYLHNKKLYYSL